MAELDLGPATGYVMLFQSYAILAIVPKTGRKTQSYKGGYAYRGCASREVRLYTVCKWALQLLLDGHIICI